MLPDFWYKIKTRTLIKDSETQFQLLIGTIYTIGDIEYENI